MKNTIHFETRKSDKVKAHPQYGKYSIWSWMDKFDANLVNLIKEQEERFYHPESKEWEMPIEACQAIVEKLENIIVKMHENGEVYTIEK